MGARVGVVSVAMWAQAQGLSHNFFAHPPFFWLLRPRRSRDVEAGQTRYTALEYVPSTRKGGRITTSPTKEMEGGRVCKPAACGESA